MVIGERGFTLKALEHGAVQWESECACTRDDLDAAGQEGVVALAKRQAWIRRKLARDFQATWASPCRIRRVRIPDRSDVRVEISDSERESDGEREGGHDGDLTREGGHDNGGDAGSDGGDAESDGDDADDEEDAPPRAN